MPKRFQTCLRATSASVLCLSLAACFSPLDGVERLSDVPISEASGNGVAALPDAAELEGENPLLAGLMAREGAEDSAEAAAPEPKRKFLFGFLKPKSKPAEAPVTDAADAESPVEASTEDTAAVETEPRKPLFGFLKRKPTEQETVEVAALETPAVVTDLADPATPVLAKAEETTDTETKGVLSWLRRQKDAPLEDKPDLTTLPEVKDAKADEAAEATVQTASLTPTGPATEKNAPGLFSLFRSKPKDAPAPKGIAFGTRVGFGSAAPLCDYPKKKIGKLVAQYPEKKPVYWLYDSAPGFEEARAFYIKGFADGCLRQVQATVVVFGSVEMHEQIRYGLPADLHPYSDTDKAYERVKRSVCKVGAKKPCGDKLPLLTPNTVFLSLYSTEVSAQDWANLLLHDGQLMASDRKSGDS
ncbi:hypothetical protein TL5118_00181 [Thalassovita autumnalis]|uniref:Uncharacterized protein n=1 Tax=Thalassovita autumnalis TaxID=2072972 RepID=A0A0P1FXF2_9RHOB|nr:hypothetical protein [Thalassovita autumnalis]CUH62790.1 hypothetical protein TL5118_00181 [Thalassovita autumnalis]CUH73533.1 hypothetical protein TL5120_03343 [Thalassovita autumnalis]